MRYAAILLLLLSAVAWPAGADEAPTGREIMERNEALQTARDEQVDVTMKLILRRGRERVREVVQVIQTGDDGLQKALIRFTGPADVRGTGLLTIEHAEREDDQWFYLPALRRTRRITPVDQTESFMGTEFTFEDMKDEDLDDFRYTRTGSETVGGAEAWIVEAVPATDAVAEDSGYSKRRLWVRKSDHVVARVEYYDGDGELAKIYTATEIAPVEGTGKSRARRVSMRDVDNDHETILLFENFRIDQGVDGSIFTQRYLERYP